MFKLSRLLIIGAQLWLLNGCMSIPGTESTAGLAGHQVLASQRSGASTADAVILGDIAPEPSFDQFCPEESESGASSHDLWDRMRAGFQLDHHAEHPRVQAELNWLRRHPEYMQRVVKRAKPYLFHIVSELESRGLPLELALLPVVESAYDPFAYSSGRASGLWQFIPSTARMLDMRMDWWVDERRDPEKATTAALVYLSRLNKSFKGDWFLSLASYNAGASNIRRAIRKNRSLGKATDYWTLSLFRETSGYVPRLLALSLLVNNPKEYNATLETIADQPYWESVPTGGQLDLAKAAELSELTVEEMYRLNPAFNQWSTHPEEPSRLLIPIDKADQFQRRLEELPPGERLRWVLHRVQKGESLSQIARQNGTTVATIKQINGLSSNLIHVGNSLMIPSPSFRNTTYALSQERRLENLKDRVQEKHKTVEYRVEKGDTLWSLAQRFGMAHKELARWNGLAPGDILKPGTILQVWGTPESAALGVRPEVIRKVNYRVRKGESLSRIASKFNLSVKHIQKWNNRVTQKNLLHPGEKLTLFVDVTQTE